jgi:integrase
MKLRTLTVRAVQKVFNDMEEEQLVIADQNAQRHTVLAESKAAWREHRSLDARRARALLKELPPFRRPKGPATLQRYLCCLSSALEDARRDDPLIENVAQFVRLTEARHHKPKLWTDARIAHWRETGTKPSPVMIWTGEQTTTALTRAKDPACGYPYAYYAALATIALLGTRRGETLALPHTNIDYATGAIDITQQLVQYGWETDIQPNTKTPDGERTAIAPETLLRILAKNRATQNEQKQAAGIRWTTTGLAFSDHLGHPIHPAKLTKALADIAAQCALPPIRVHDLRHGLATHARAEGVEDSVLSGMLGHASKWFTSAFYGDIVNEVKRAASEKIAERFALDEDD